MENRGRLRLLVTTGSEDLLHGLQRYDLWGRIGFMEIKRRYRRTLIGPFWSTISLAVFIAVMSAVGVGLWKQTVREYMPFLATGMMVWLLISTMINESCTLFINSQHLFSRMRIDYSILAFALVWRNLVGFLHNLTAYLLVAVVALPGLINLSLLWIIPGLFLIAVNAVWVALLLGMACIRFRDIQQLVISLLQISMFVTPVFWPPHLLTGTTKLVFVQLNPLYSFIEVVRAPLLGQTPMLSAYIMIVAVTLVGWTVTFKAFSKLPKKNCVLGVKMATILVENVDLDFPIYGMQRSLRRALFQNAAGGFINKKDLQHRHVTVTALAGVSLQLNDGDRLGLVGHNGAGKSSLLKVLAGIYHPTRGKVWVDGKISSLFELALNIDIDDTGYETIVTAGMVHGLTQSEMEGKIPDIERFSELGEYLSLPVRTYSMGMTTRLGFSLATVLEPEICCSMKVSVPVMHGSPSAHRNGYRILLRKAQYWSSPVTRMI